MNMYTDVISGTVEEVIFRNEENGYTVAVLECKNEYVTIVGNLPRCKNGINLRLTGKLKEHPRYGEQFAFTEFEEIMPEGSEAIFLFLKSGVISGVGEQTARRIVERFGDETLEVIEKEPKRLTEVSGIGKKTCEKIAASYSSHIQFANVAMWLQKYGITSNQALKLYKEYGNATVSLIEENPYRLVEEVRGFNFHSADKIAMKLGIGQDSPFRIKSGIRYVLTTFVSDGNTFMPLDTLIERTIELLDVSTEQINDNIMELGFECVIKIDMLNDVQTIYPYSYYNAERKVASNIMRLLEGVPAPLTADPSNIIADFEVKSGVKLSALQKEAVLNSINETVSIITGGPGTGKTTIINSMIRIFKMSALEVKMAAPTGRAAKRISETCGYEAYTIHRLLEYAYAEDADQMKFGKNEEEQLKCDVIIIDEASMIDVMLMKGLTDAIATNTRLVMIGDADQLPPVGAGNVLRDMIESEAIYSTRLREVFRQAEESLIVVNAHRINGGEYPYFNEADKDFFFINRSHEEDIVNSIVELATKRLENYYEGIDKLKDIQVITPIKKGAIGTHNLNMLLQEALNPKHPDKEERNAFGKTFREGDKVMQIKNNYRMNWKKRSDLSEGQGVFNGDVGYIVRIDNDDEIITVMFDDERFVSYEFSQLDELELAYALTVHKSQGCEFPIVIMPMSHFPAMLATRNLLYTAVTRGKNLVVMCGSQKRMEAMVDNNRVKQIYSGLSSRLRKSAF